VNVPDKKRPDRDDKAGENQTGATPNGKAPSSPLTGRHVSAADGSAAAPATKDQASMVVVANRLPFDLQKLPDGSTKARQAPGGLVTALAPILAKREGAWIGWPGQPDEDPGPTTTDGLTLYPVPLSADEVEAYYEGFSNATLWPLYHDAVADSEFHRQWWDSYRQVNRRFATRAAEIAAKGATVWVHDYQLQLVPRMLRELRPDVRIGFFLHIPFPPVELFVRLPWRTQVITGLLGADLIGFQLPGGARNFVRLARQLAGAATSGSAIEFEGRTIRAGSFPISIDSAAQSQLATSPPVTEAAANLRHDLGDPRRIILGVDRLDYTKGINIRLQAFEELLAAKDPAVKDTVMVQIATPSRERLTSYVRMREEIERQVGALNGEHGRIGRPAVHYLHQSFPREDLAAFYAAADVMAVTPLRDGMNLVAKEYVACRTGTDGVLVLSEFTGAASELRSALLVNPYDIEGVKDGLRSALTMSGGEARRRMRLLRRQVLGHDVDRWAMTFLSALEDTKDPVAAAVRRLPVEAVAAVSEICDTPNLLVGTDFDGTLAPLVDDPSQARALPASVEALRVLASLPGTTVAVVSGRSLDDLRRLLGDVGPARLIGSHGAEAPVIAGIVGMPTRDNLSAVQSELLERVETEAARLAKDREGVHLERKPTGIAVHLRSASTEDAAAVANELRAGVARWPGVNLLRGKKVFELSVVETDKGTAFAELVDEIGATATVFIGDDVTDEHAFEALGPRDLTVKVGGGPTNAGVRIAGPAQVADLLTILASARHPERVAAAELGS